MIINTKSATKVFAALPVLDEADNLPIIINNLLSQEDVDLKVIICVNQPDEWWENDKKLSVCLNNQKSLDFLHSINDERIIILDRTSKGNGWIGKRHGVGWARKVAMDTADSMAAADDVIISVDADTYYTPQYFSSVVHALQSHIDAVAYSAPYYHQLTGNEITDRCILRYEIYMRNYALNMLLIQNPYCFSAIGSGMACTAANYRKVCGLTPKMSGEDFYFILKLRKAGRIIIDGQEEIYPASRFSDRVYFGTGPAMIKGRTGNWDSYPIYNQDLFLDIRRTYDLFDELFLKDVVTPLDDFIVNAWQVVLSDFWQPLRNNSKSSAQFAKAASHKIDALRILQYLKEQNSNDSASEELKLHDFLTGNFNPGEEIIAILNDLLIAGFENIDIQSLNLIRDYMFVNERKIQRKIKLA